MTSRTDSLPDPTHPDAGVALFGTWWVGTPERQQAAVDAIVTAWEHQPWPSVGLLSYSVFASTDGETLLHYSQFAVVNAGRMSPSPSDPWKEVVDAAVPGIERTVVVGYRLYRSLIADRESHIGRPGCIVIVVREVDGPDPERARQWVDALFALPEIDAPVPGLMSAHFHISTDGCRVLNYAQWADEQAHRAFAEANSRKVAVTDEWRRVRGWPGLISTEFNRFRCQLRLAGVQHENDRQ